MVYGSTKTLNAFNQALLFFVIAPGGKSVTFLSNELAIQKRKLDLAVVG